MGLYSPPPPNDSQQTATMSISSSSWQQETETLRQAIIGMAEGEEKTRQEQAFAQRNASHALEQLAKNNSSKFTVIDPKKRPLKLTKKEQRKKDAEEYARAKRQRKAEEEDEEELREEEELLNKEEREVERYDDMIRVLTANKDQELRMVESAEKELAEFTALEASTRADLERFERSTDPALKCYFSAMRQLKNIVDYPGYVRDDKNEILLELRASYDKFQAKYKVSWEAYEWGHKAKTVAHTMAAMHKRHTEERLGDARRRLSNTDRELARIADKRALAAAAAAAAAAPL